jgi:hypothetical protein
MTLIAGYSRVEPTTQALEARLDALYRTMCDLPPHAEPRRVAEAEADRIFARLRVAHEGSTAKVRVLFDRAIEAYEAMGAQLSHEDSARRPIALRLAAYSAARP